jgi:hypothetical protein
VFGGAWVLARLMASAGVLAVAWRRSQPGRLVWFTGGLVQIAGDGAEPRVIRWAEAETVVMTFGWDFDLEDPVTGPVSCALLGGAGVRIHIAEECGRRLLKDLATAAVRNPRGTAGSAADPGLRVRARRPLRQHPGQPRRRHQHPARGPRVHRLDAGPEHCPARRQRTGRQGVLFDNDHRSIREIDLSAIPNGCFMPHLIHHAATRNRMMLLGDAWPETSTTSGPSDGTGADSH